MDFFQLFCVEENRKTFGTHVHVDSGIVGVFAFRHLGSAPGARPGVRRKPVGNVVAAVDLFGHRNGIHRGFRFGGEFSEIEERASAGTAGFVLGGARRNGAHFDVTASRANGGHEFRLSVGFEIFDSGLQFFVFFLQFFHRFYEHGGNVGVLDGFVSVSAGSHESWNLLFHFLGDESDLGSVSFERVFPFERDSAEAGNGFESVRKGFDILLEAFVGSDVERGRVYGAGMPRVAGGREIMPYAGCRF